MKDLRVGYDMDGTLQKKSPSWVWRFGPLFGNVYRRLFCDRMLIRPTDTDFVVVSGRPESDRWWTERWLKRHGLHPRKVVLCGDFSGALKAEAIDRFGINLYFEDERDIASLLRERCVGCVIVEVNTKER